MVVCCAGRVGWRGTAVAGGLVDKDKNLSHIPVWLSRELLLLMSCLPLQLLQVSFVAITMMDV